MPQKIINKLKLQHNDNLIVECGHNGFVVCRVEGYENWLDKLEMELLELDDYSRRKFGKSLNTLNKKNDESLKDKQETEVL